MKFYPIFIQELESEINLTKIMTYLHFYDFNSLQIIQSQYLFDIGFAKQILLMIISNGTFIYIYIYFYLLILYIYITIISSSIFT